MGKSTGIDWATSTFNPWMGCVKVSTECASCYAETLTSRWGGSLWGADAPRQVTSDSYWRGPLRWNREAEATGKPWRVFCASLADVFEDRRDLDLVRLRLWELIDATPALTWLLLTKRPDKMLDLTPRDFWTRPNVWAGTTVGHPGSMHRAEALLRVPARVRFLSCEPLVAPLDISHLLDRGYESGGPEGWVGEPSIDWVIVGGESGAKPREMREEWVRSLRDQTKAAGAAFFYKQGWGHRPEKLPELDGKSWSEVPS